MSAPVRRAFSGAPWEAKVGYCRALRRGAHVWVTGTVAMDEKGGVFAPGDPQAQARRCFEIIAAALVDVGATLSDIVRTRMFVTDIDHWEAFGRAHGEVFSDHPPATSMIEISRLISPGFLVEIEADAFVDD
ncbi:RidA family protein [uncultured Maricaulis sp.]|uniref:RidA family protein n=1 Tax=uncultured Maricaulis sp. TaxID=174710 RepID=UPI0030DD15A6